ncbi:ABC transporter substrate-binding protein [Flavobacterium gawalongense]|uniref:ABC transporter substrate-binding protein n=1 Tax=Flavobacterium gawalongense TaxID=2594432 RepID=A0A553BE36_9FLAO|nr:ABC transporter substrate-binding protein [Flavobacterium gawalongense]TRW98896.1 ABC transporter substrate-binding protein [Flavobacterium gawalongense]TRX03519.1 ABC transporter substrate-binding protein [Flavobacterium gawalongense]TRX06482.1 ABC transporter substrate-binding protein [Flavobacterium gawalongense]TRX07307.1 ABC transporter substrate-binding protein [Flavobacterium gawalongense]TRX24989.1 ABC transporter substrate-binding protein [Flavobacterium gawalongense]
MKFPFYKILFVLSFLAFIGCKKNEKSDVAKTTIAKNTIEYASGLAIYEYDGYSVVKVINPWPDANKNFTYVLKEKNSIVPDSLQKYTAVQVPLQSIVVTSTTNIPFLEILGVEKSLVGFPHTDYISSEKTRKLIDVGSVKNVGQNEKLNMEQLIELTPDLIVTFGIDNNNPMIKNLEKSGLKVMIQGDWMEQSPLGKAEWLKLYGALFGKEKEAKTLFDNIVKNYNEALKLVSNKKPESTVLYGSMYQDQWFVAKGNSWVAQFMKDAKANYLWSNVEGTGSLGLSFENILDKAKSADYWIASGPFKTISELGDSNPHYSQFDAFASKNVYTFESKLGAKGGTIYYELAPSRPDLVLKDYIKIFHPELLPKYTFTFAQKLN